MSKFLAIPTDLIKSGKLTHTELFIYIEICNLTELKKGCIASNNHFAELLGMTVKSVSNIISSLVKKGFIKTEIKKGSRNQIRRIFTIHNSGNSYPQNMDRVSTKYGESKENRLIEDTKERKNTKKDLDLDEIQQEVFEETDLAQYPINKNSFKEWIEFRKEIKKPITRLTAKKQFKLLCCYPEDTQAEIINFSIQNSYQGLFAPKQNKFQSQPQKTKDQIRREQIDKHFADLYPEKETYFDFDGEIVE